MEKESSLGSMIIKFCSDNNITVNKFANLAGITQSTIDSIIKGKSKNPRTDTYNKIYKTFSDIVKQSPQKSKNTSEDYKKAIDILFPQLSIVQQSELFEIVLRMTSTVIES